MTIQTEKLNFQNTEVKKIFITTLQSGELKKEEAEDIYDNVIVHMNRIFGPSMALLTMNSISSRLKFDYMLFIKTLYEYQMDEEILLKSGLTEDDIKNLEDYV